MRTRFKIGLTSLLTMQATIGCNDSRISQLEQENELLKAQIDRLETEIDQANAEPEVLTDEVSPSPMPKTDAPDISTRVPEPNSQYILLVNGNRVETFTSLERCERAADQVNHDADREQARRDALNEQELAKEGPPGIIWGRVKRQNTQCLDLTE